LLGTPTVPTLSSVNESQVIFAAGDQKVLLTELEGLVRFYHGSKILRPFCRVLLVPRIAS